VRRILEKECNLPLGKAALGGVYALLGSLGKTRKVDKVILQKKRISSCRSEQPV